MATETKSELEEKLAAALEENQKLKDAGMMDLSEYIQKIDKLTKENEKKGHEIDNLKENWARELREREILAQDTKNKEHEDKLPYQTHHTGYRLLPRPYKLDIFGDVGRPVFDLGVTLDNYSGHVDIPMQVVVEMAQSIGMLTLDQAEELNKDLEVERARNEAAGRLGNILASGIGDLVSQFGSGLSAIDHTALEEKLARDNANDENDSSSDDEGSGNVSAESDDSESGDDSTGPKLDLSDFDLD